MTIITSIYNNIKLSIDKHKAIKLVEHQIKIDRLKSIAKEYGWPQIMIDHIEIKHYNENDIRGITDIYKQLVEDGK